MIEACLLLLQPDSDDTVLDDPKTHDEDREEEEKDRARDATLKARRRRPRPREIRGGEQDNPKTTIVGRREKRKRRPGPKWELAGVRLRLRSIGTSRPTDDDDDDDT